MADPPAHGPLETAIVDTTLLTMRDDRLGIVDDGAVGIADGELAYVGPADGIDRTAAGTVLDASGCVTLPGLIDAHAHMRHTLLRGGAQDVPEREWMDRALGPIAAHMTDEDEVTGATLGALEAVRAGTTTVTEYAADVERLVEAVYRPIGLRVVATETINAVDPAQDRAALGPDDPYAFDRAKGERGLDRANALVERYADAARVEPMYGPQAADMLPGELLGAVGAAARARDAGVHMHVAQGDRERRQLEARYGPGTSAVDLLEARGLLEGRLIAAHCHGTTPDERDRLVAAGASMVGCPSSIGGIDGRVPPMADFHDRGGTVGLGTDQAPGAGHHDLLREARTAALLAKVDATDPTALPAWRALRMATIGGARALGIAERVGSLAVGKRADVTVIDLTDVGLGPTVSAPFHTAVPNVVYSATGRAVRDVFVGGHPVVRDGAVTTADPEAVLEEAQRRATAVFDRAAVDWRAAGSELVAAADAGWL